MIKTAISMTRGMTNATRKMTIRMTATPMGILKNRKKSDAGHSDQDEDGLHCDQLQRMQQQEV